MNSKVLNLTTISMGHDSIKKGWLNLKLLSYPAKRNRIYLLFNRFVIIRNIFMILILLF